MPAKARIGAAFGVEVAVHNDAVFFFIAHARALADEAANRRESIIPHKTMKDRRKHRGEAEALNKGFAVEALADKERDAIDLLPLFAEPLRLNAIELSEKLVKLGLRRNLLKDQIAALIKKSFLNRRDRLAQTKAMRERKRERLKASGRRSLRRRRRRLHLECARRFLRFRHRLTSSNGSG